VGYVRPRTVARERDRNDNPAVKSMRAIGLMLAMGACLLLVACDDGGKAGASGAGGRAGGGARGGAGGQAGGTDGGSPACSAASPCGGDIVGTWKVTESCLSASEDLSTVCAGVSADIQFTFSGTTTYSADGTYTSATSGGGLTTYHYPAACLTGGETCDQLGQVLMAVGMYSSVSCATDTAGVCNCAAVTASTSSNETGTYATSGSTLTLTHAGATSMAPYCVQGNALFEFEAPGDGGVTLTGSIELARQ
jgi:hypothetical protein